MFNFIKKKKDLASNLQNPQRNSTPPSSVKHSLLSLEQRLMFDAAAAATASEVASEQVAQEQAEAAVSGEASYESTDGEKRGGEDVVQALTNYMPAEKCVEVAFVDPTVPNYQELLAGMDPDVEVIMLDGDQDGVEQMAEILSGRTGIDAIHLISHGSSGELQLGTGTLNTESMSTEYADEFKTIRGALSDQADLLVYGCNFAEGVEGVDAVNLLAELTGADVAASSDQTGHIDLGGDWEFEVQVGSIETDLALTDTVQMNWAGILQTETVGDAFSTKTYDGNNGTQSWSTSWSEVDVGASEANSGHIKVNSGQLRIDAVSVGEAISRGVDLSSAKSATLSFDYVNDMSKEGCVDIRISTDGGTSYQTLNGGTFSRVSHTGNGTASLDISDYASANTKIQFIVTESSGGDRLLIDNVQIGYSTNEAPTVTSLSSTTVAKSTAVGMAVGTDRTISDTKGQTDKGDTKSQADKDNAKGQSDVNDAPTDLSLSANCVAENAATGTVVGTVTSTDPDAGDTKSYSLTDTAGGRFAINANTGVLTVANGSLLNYESAPSHMVTVRVTDSGGQSYTETFTINLTNVNEAATGAESTDALMEDMANTLTTTTLGIHDTHGSPKTASSEPHISNELEESGFILPNTVQNMSQIMTAAPSIVEILTPERTHLSVASEEPVGNGMNSKETQRSSNQTEKRGSYILHDRTDVQSTAAAEADRKDFLEPDDPIENEDESTALKLSATMGLAGVVLQNSLGNTTKLGRFISRPARAPNVPPNTTPQKSPVDDLASNQNGSEHHRSAAEDADPAET